MDIYQTEEEQIQRIKDLWKKYGTSILFGVAIAIFAIFAWKYWQQREIKIAANASSTYDNIVAGIIQQNPSLVQDQANHIIKDYASSPYAKLAALMLAKQNIAAGNYQQAEKHLQWVVSKAKTKEIKQIAKIRLARIYVSQQKAKTALSILATVNDKAFLPLINEVRGDGYKSLGETEKARQAYNAALQGMPQTANIAPYIEMKRDNL